MDGKPRKCQGQDKPLALLREPLGAPCFWPGRIQASLSLQSARLDAQWSKVPAETWGLRGPSFDARLAGPLVRLEVSLCVPPRAPLGCFKGPPMGS